MAGRRQQDYDYLVKLLLIGDSGTYETLKVHRFPHRIVLPYLLSYLIRLYIFPKLMDHEL